MRLAPVVAAGSAGAVWASWCTARSKPDPEAEHYHLVWTPEQIRAVLEKYIENRQLENIVAALGIGGAIVTDIGMVTGTGLLGIVFGAGAVVSYVWCHMEHVNGDKNGRLRFIDVSPTHEGLLGLLEYHNLKHEQPPGAILKPEHPLSLQVARVGTRIAKATKAASLALADELELVPGGTEFRDAQAPGKHAAPTIWEFNVIDSSDVNAFVLPGGKVFVHRGLMELLPTDDELAVILSHEAAHVQARHTAERLSMQRFPNILKMVLWTLVLVGFVPYDGSAEVLVLLKTAGIDLTAYMLLALPYSRVHEKEADVLGLEILARACISPATATKVWRKFAQSSPKGAPHVLLSTHPTHEQRLEYIKELEGEKTEDYCRYCPHDHTAQAILQGLRSAEREKARRQGRIETIHS